jgi:hypothetical protein
MSENRSTNRGINRFPTMHWTLLDVAREPMTLEPREARNCLIVRYWRPIYHCRTWSARAAPLSNCVLNTPNGPRFTPWRSMANAPVISGRASSTAPCPFRYRSPPTEKRGCFMKSRRRNDNPIILARLIGTTTAMGQAIGLRPALVSASHLRPNAGRKEFNPC